MKLFHRSVLRSFFAAQMTCCIGIADVRATSAAIVRWSFEGTVINGIAMPDLSPNDPVRGVFSFDDQAVDQDPEPRAGNYDLTGRSNVFITAGPFTVVGRPTAFNPGLQNLYVLDSPEGVGGDNIEFRLSARTFLDGRVSNAEGYFSLTVGDDVGEFLSSDAIPASPPTFDAIAFKSLGFAAQSGLVVVAMTALGSEVGPGDSPDTARLPSGGSGTSADPWRFDETPSGQWTDPPHTGGFAYEMQSDSLFTAIVGFPEGFASKFEVSVDGVSVGEFGPSDWVDFSGFAEGGVKHFALTGIDPQVDLADPQAFPLQLLFNTPTADFTMAAILLGDTNDDGRVDIVDLNNVRNHFGEQNAAGDTNGDSQVDIVDLNNVRNHFGESTVGSAVPEPGGLLLALVTAFALAGTIRRCRS